jgi:hypothetical protein
MHQFPKSRSVLWDRSTQTEPQILSSTCIVPPLYLSPFSVQSLLDELSSSDVTIERRAVVDRVEFLSKLDSDVLKRPLMRKALGHQSSILKIESNFYERRLEGREDECRRPAPYCSHADVGLTIPVTLRDRAEDEFVFDDLATE